MIAEDDYFLVLLPLTTPMAEGECPRQTPGQLLQYTKCLAMCNNYPGGERPSLNLFWWLKRVYECNYCLPHYWEEYTSFLYLFQPPQIFPHIGLLWVFLNLKQKINLWFCSLLDPLPINYVILNKIVFFTNYTFYVF